MPGANPKGNLPQKAITTQPTIAAKAVDVNTAPEGIPSNNENIAGLTAKMYDIVRNIVIPAITSVRTDIFDASNPNNLFNIYSPI